MPTWYDQSLFILHFDHHFSPQDHPQPLIGFDRDQVQRLLQEVRPDAVQYYAKGHPGYVPYTTAFGNQLPSVGDDPSQDILRAYREITQELGIKLVLAYSGLIDHLQSMVRPDWQRVTLHRDPYPNRALCPNSGYVEELLLPQLEELLERYSPDGIWMDAENWTVSPCYCPACESEYQMLHSRSAPTSRSDAWWTEWLQFHRDSFQRYLQRVGRYLHDRNPDLVYASNGSYSSHQPELPAPGPDRLTRDLSPAFSLRPASLEARLLGSTGLPFDLMTWTQCSARPWATGRLPALPAYSKTFDHLAQEGAVILANGGRWSVWVNTYPDDVLPESQQGLVAAAAEFARNRRAACHDSDSGAYVAVLHSAATHKLAGNGLYDPGPSLDRVRGAHQALLELHHPHDILSEQALPALLQCYQVLVLPEQISLPHELDDKILEWVRGGGRLIASGKVSPRVMEDVPTFALEEALGVRWTGQTMDGGWILQRGVPMRIAGPIHHVGLVEAENMRPFVASGHEEHLHDTGYPAVARHTFGEGEVYYIAADFFAAYHRSQYPGFRHLLADILEQALPQPPLLTTAPPTIEVAWRTKGDQTILHFVNHDPGRSLAQNSAFIEEVPPSPPFSVTVTVEARPAVVRLAPEGTEPEWSYAEGTLTVFVPPVHLHTALVITPEA